MDLAASSTSGQSRPGTPARVDPPPGIDLPDASGPRSSARKRAFPARRQLRLADGKERRAKIGRLHLELECGESDVGTDGGTHGAGCAAASARGNPASARLETILPDLHLRFRQESPAFQRPMSGSGASILPVTWQRPWRGRSPEPEGPALQLRRRRQQREGMVRAARQRHLVQRQRAEVDDARDDRGHGEIPHAVRLPAKDADQAKATGAFPAPRRHVRGDVTGGWRRPRRATGTPPRRRGRRGWRRRGRGASSRGLRRFSCGCASPRGSHESGLRSA